MSIVGYNFHDIEMGYIDLGASPQASKQEKCTQETFVIIELDEMQISFNKEKVIFSPTLHYFL